MKSPISRKSLAATVALLALLLLSQSASAQVPTSYQSLPNYIAAQSVCSGLIDPNQTIFSLGIGSASSMLGISIVIMLVMLLVVSMLYALGYAFKIDRLVRFSRAEVGEVIVTAIVVFIFIGTFSLTQASAARSGVSQSFSSQGTFASDCAYLASESFNLVPPLVSYGIQQLGLNLLYGLRINLMPSGFGASFTLFEGLRVAGAVLGSMIYITGALATILFGSTILLSIIYSLFPIFLFAGILLRTLPWTRPAGGAMLGLFAAFYIVFPLLLFALFNQFIPCAIYLQQGYSCSGTQVAPSGFSQSTTPFQSGQGIGGAIGSAFSAGSYLTGIFKFFSGTGGLNPFYNLASATSTLPTHNGIINGFVSLILEPVIYEVFTVIIVFIISFDFMEAMGDFLGAPSLSSKNSLRRLL